MNLQLKKFKPEGIADDKVIVFIGKRNTGKSTLVKDIMYHKKHLPAGIVLSGTEEGNHFYSEFIPDLFIYGDYDRDAIERVMGRQRKLVGGGKTNCGAFMLLDDCMYDNILQNREKLYKSFFGIFPSFDMFNKVMDACTENYECLVLDNTVKSNKIQDCVFWYKATVRKNFKVGSPDLWKLHKKMYNPKHMDQKEQDPKKASKKTSLTITKRK